MKKAFQIFNLFILGVFIVLIIFSPLAGLMFAIPLGAIHVLTSIVLCFNKSLQSPYRIGHLIHWLLSVLVVGLSYLNHFDYLAHASIALGVFFLVLLFTNRSSTSALY